MERNEVRTRLVIDDERTFDCDEPVLHIRTVDEALLWLVKKFVAVTRLPLDSPREFIYIWFDHDMGENGGDIRDIVRFLNQTKTHFSLYNVLFIAKVHSQNPIGAQNLCREINFAVNAPETFRVPLPILKEV